MKIQQHFSEKEYRVLQERATRVRHPVTNARTIQAIPLVHIWLGEEVYVIPIINLITVHQDIPVVPVPCVPAFIAGVANIRGRVMPVIDLARLLDIATAPSKSHSQVLVVVGVETQQMVFKVSRIDDSSMTRLPTLYPLPDTFDIPYPQFVAGLLGDGTPQLDVVAILNSPVLVVNNSIDTLTR